MPRDPHPPVERRESRRARAAIRSMAIAGDRVPASSLVTPHDVVTREGDYFRVFRLEGVQWQAASPADVQRAHEAVCAAVRQLTPDCAIWMHRIRRHVGVDVPAVDGPWFDADYDRHYQARINEQPFLVTEIYLTLIFRPVPTRLTGLFTSKSRTRNDVDERQRAALHALEERAHALQSALAEFDPQLLGDRIEAGGARYSEVAEFLAYLVNGRHRKIKAPVRAKLYDVLPECRLSFAETGYTGELRDELTGERRYFAAYDIKEYDSQIEPGALNALLMESCEFVETLSFSLRTRRSALSWLDRQRKQLLGAKDVVTSQIDELDQALNDVGDGLLAFGEFHYGLIVFAGSPADAILVGSRIKGAVANDASIELYPTAEIVDAAWRSQMPCTWKLRTRRAAQSSRAFAAMAGAHGFVHGKRDGTPWGAPVTVFRTQANEPYYFNFHSVAEDEDATGLPAPGNTLVLGSTGSGKTTVENHLLVQARRCAPAPRILFFDCDRGSELLIRALGGTYYLLEPGEPTGFNPLQRDPTPSRKQHWIALVVRCIEDAGEPLDAADRQSIAQAIDTLAELPRDMRTFTRVRELLPRGERNSLSSRLARWCADGELGWVFDRAPERLADLSTTQCLGIDYTKLLTLKSVTPVVMMYLLDVIDEMLDGRRLIICIAEFWKALGDPMFQQIIKDKLKVIRKENGLVIFDTQSPSDALDSPIGATVAEQCVTKILLYNERPVREQYLQGLNLSEGEFAAVAGFRKGGRSFLVKQGHRSAVVELDLTGMHDELQLLSGTKDQIALAQRLRASHGDDPAVWLPLLRAQAREARFRRGHPS